MTDVGRILWQGCHTLRHEGVAYDEYVDQLSLLLFLKMATELGTALPAGASWRELVECSDDSVLDEYRSMLKVLGGEPGLVGDIFHNARSLFRTPDGLRHVLRLLNKTNWTALEKDVQGASFEYLLERTASEGKQGAGQYFTPRPLVETIVACIQPGIKATDQKVCDPAAGTAGFLVEAHRWLATHSPDRLSTTSLVGGELVPRARRLGLMNLYVHGARDPEILHGDALANFEAEKQYDVVITNPPFGSRSGPRPVRKNFWLQTGNKQLNFIQHITLGLSRHGRAAIVLPDNCFNGDSASCTIWDKVFDENRVHTVLRLPRGTFAPYTSGIMTNVVFFSAGESTEETWIYDARTNSRVPTGRSPLQRSELQEFTKCFGGDADGKKERSATDSVEGRWSRHSIDHLRSNAFRLDFAELPYTDGDRPRAVDLLSRAEDDLTAALKGIRKLQRTLRGND